MAWSQVGSAATGSDKAAANLALSMPTVQVGDLIVICGSVDSTISGSVVNDPSDDLGNTYDPVPNDTGGFAIVETGNSSTTVDIAIWYSIVTTAGTPTVTITFSGTSNARAAIGWVFRPDSGSTITVVDTSTNTNGPTSSSLASVTEGATHTIGDLVVGAIAWEGTTGDWPGGGDSDTGGGAWSTDASIGTAGGSAATNCSIGSQWKTPSTTTVQSYNLSLGATRDWAAAIVAFHFEVSGDTSVDGETYVGARAHSSADTISITGSSKASVGVHDRAGATRDYSVSASLPVGVQARSVPTRDYSTSSQTFVGVQPHVSQANDIQVECKVAVGAQARAGALYELTYSAKTYVGAQARAGAASPSISAASKVAAGAHPRSQPTIDVSVLGDAYVGTYQWAVPAGNDAFVNVLAVVGAFPQSGGAQFWTSHIPLCYIRTGPWSYAGGATPSITGLSMVRVGARTSTLIDTDRVVSGRLLVGAQARAGALFQPTIVDGRARVGAQARAGGSLLSVDRTGRVAVGAHAKTSPTVEISPGGIARVGAFLYRAPFTITGSAAIVLSRMIVLGYGSTPISQALVNRRKHRGGMEPPTGPPERRDFFDVRRGQTEAWFAPTLLNSWVVFGGSNMDPGYRKEGDTVQLRGLVKNGTVGAGTPIFVLPEFYRPSDELIFAVLSNDALGQVRIDASGNVTARLPSVNTWVSLDTIRFSVTP